MLSPKKPHVPTWTPAPRKVAPLRNPPSAWPRPIRLQWQSPIRAGWIINALIVATGAAVAAAGLLSGIPAMHKITMLIFMLSGLGAVLSPILLPTVGIIVLSMAIIAMSRGGVGPALLLLFGLACAIALSIVLAAIGIGAADYHDRNAKASRKATPTLTSP